MTIPSLTGDAPNASPCPRCESQRLSVIYYDGDGDPIGGLSQCTDCGPRHAEHVVFKKAKRRELLERKAS